MSDKALFSTEFLSVPHAFSTRLAGVSEGVFASFNLGLSTGDKPERVVQNREQVFRSFGVTKAQVCGLHQVHSATVVEARASWFELEADASVSNDPDLLLVIGTADCLPILFHDPVKQVVAAAHAGWRGTVAGVSRNVILKMQSLYGSKASDVRAVIGPCIKGACYQVGQEVIDVFIESEFPEYVYENDTEGRYLLDLVKANEYLLKQSGVTQIYDLQQCTHCDATTFYSHRRDGLKRGSHWSAIKLAQT